MRRHTEIVSVCRQSQQIYKNTSNFNHRYYYYSTKLAQHQQRRPSPSAHKPPSSTLATTSSSQAIQHQQPIQPYPSFYHNRVLDKYVSQDAKRVTLRQLTVFGRTLTSDKLFRSANYVRNELSVRLAHRIADFQSLPFIVGSNPHISHVYGLYWKAFELFRAVKEIGSLEDNRRFCALVQSQLKEHLVVIPQLAMGIAESSPHFADERVANRFMNEMLRSRIGRRVLAEQHIALSAVYDGTKPEQPGFIGVVDTNVHAGRTVTKCAKLARDFFAGAFEIAPPEIEIDGAVDANFTYVPDHVEYILYELLKNAVRGTIETWAPKEIVDAAYARAMYKSPDSKSNDNHPGTSYIRDQADQIMNNNIEVKGLEGMRGGTGTVVNGLSSAQTISLTEVEDEHDVGLYGQINPNEETEQQNIHHASKCNSPNLPLPTIRVTIGASATFLTFRISDQAGGIAKSLLSHIWSYSSTSKQNFLYFSHVPQWAARIGEKSPPLLQLGLGLPMSKVYANYWGGNVLIQTMDKYGTDVYVNIYTGNSLEDLKYKEE